MKVCQLVITMLFFFGAISCSQKGKAVDSNATQQAIQLNINEINQLIKTENWEKARMTAESTSDAYATDMTAVESAQMVLIYIQLLSEPQMNTNFEKYYLYAKRIVQFHDSALNSDPELTRNYYLSKGVENIIKDTYENALYIIQAKEKAGKDSTYVSIKPTEQNLN